MTSFTGTDPQNKSKNLRPKAKNQEDLTDRLSPHLRRGNPRAPLPDANARDRRSSLTPPLAAADPLCPAQLHSRAAAPPAAKEHPARRRPARVAGARLR